MQVTVSGGTSVGPVVLNFGANDLAVVNAQAIAALIDANYTTPIVYSGRVTGTATNALLIEDNTSGTIKATGFGAIIDDNNSAANTIIGGGDLTGVQYVLASDGGLKFTAASGAVDLAVGGGDNDISFSGDTSDVSVYIAGGGDNTIKGGDGATTIAAGAGDNLIKLGAGSSLVDATGMDTVKLGSGSATIDASLDSAGVFVRGSTVAGGTGYTLTFIGGAAADTVKGVTGSYSITGGSGGGLFFGGSSGDNYIYGGSGAATIIGGGNGDTLIGGAAGDLIVAGIGNETLTGHSFDATFSFALETNSTTNDTGNVVVITDFLITDTLKLGGKAADMYASSHETVVGGNTDFLLQDGTKVVLEGFTSTVKFH